MLRHIGNPASTQAEKLKEAQDLLDGLRKSTVGTMAGYAAKSKSKAKAKATNEKVIVAGGETVAAVNIAASMAKAAAAVAVAPSLKLVVLCSGSQ